MKGKNLTWLVGLVLIVGALAALQYKKNGKAEVTYRPVEVNRADLKITILATGTVSPENRIDLKPPVAGRVEKVLVEEGANVREGQVLAWLSSAERAALIDTAKSQGKSELAYWQDAYKMTPILAPKKGLIILKNADAGQSVTQSDIVLSMSDRLITKVNVDETDLAQIKIGQAVELVLDAFPSNMMPAKVAHIGYDAKTINNVTTYEVDVMPDSAPEFMKSGMTANATFVVDAKEKVLSVPASAVHRKDKRSYVLLPNPENKKEPREQTIETGITDGKRIEILSGLKEGDSVLVASIGSFTKDDKGANPLSPFGGPRPKNR